MRMKRLVARARRYARRKLSRSRTRMAIGAFGAVLAVIGLVAASMLSAPANRTEDQVAAARVAEITYAREELAAPAANYAAATSRPAAASATAKASPVTLTGCLERRGDDFRLKDAAGTDALRTRSWKSGFLKKSTPAIDVVDANNRLKLKDYVGERVSITGLLNDRAMQARSVKNVAASCSD
jgi:hypothetical protein